MSGGPLGNEAGTRNPVASNPHRETPTILLAETFSEPLHTGLGAHNTSLLIRTDLLGLFIAHLPTHSTNSTLIVGSIGL